jgi:hypothetical protein
MAEQQQFSLQDALLLLSQFAQAAAPTESQRGYQRGVEDIFDPKVLAISDPFSAEAKLPTLYSEDDLIDLYAPDLRLYGTSDPDSLEAGIFADVLGKRNLAEINKSIRAGYEAELDRLQTLNPNLALIDTPTIEDYLQIGKDLYKDYSRVRSEDKKQQLAFAEAKEKGNIFKQAGYPDMFETYQPREFFAPQYEAVDQELMKRFAAIPELANFDPIAFKVPPQPAAQGRVPGAILAAQGRAQGRTGSAPQPSRTADANMDVQSQARDFREKVLAELDKIATKKIQESGRSPFLDKATRALSVGR